MIEIDLDWISQLTETLPQFMQRLRSPDNPGRFFPCVKGLTEAGRKVSLGFSTFAVKIYYTIGLWEKISASERDAWVGFIKLFQTPDSKYLHRVTRCAFIDLAEISYLASMEKFNLYAYWLYVRSQFNPVLLTKKQYVIYAETKQAIATLVQLGDTSYLPYQGYPLTTIALDEYLHHLDWTMPWGAGGRSSVLAVFFKTQCPRFLTLGETQVLLDALSNFYNSIADKITGAYFIGTPPGYNQLINGAMKVLTALDWLEVPIQYPERLIDTCLTQLPASDGCHLVDTVYVLYRCLHQIDYKKKEIQAYCVAVLEMIKRHYNPDGGFSYNIGSSQTGYYGVPPITLGLAESDIHGIVLLTWAVAMILEINEVNRWGWKVVKP